MSAARIAALHMAKARYKDKKVVKDSDGKDMTVYEYSDRQVSKRNNDKADRVQKLRSLRSDLVKRVKKDYKAKDLKTRLTALAVGLIDHTYERVGNDESAGEGHFGVTGWLVKHVSFSGGKATIRYVGKSAVKQTKVVTDPGAVKLLKEAVKGKSPGDQIFTCDDAGEKVCVTSAEVNAYLPEGITAKDLRGLHANEEMLVKLKAQRKGPLPSDKKKREKKLKDEFKRALEETAKVVGHEPSTLRSQYLVPAMEDAYMKDGTVIDKLNEKRSSLEAAWDHLATKTDEEKKDEDADKNVRKDPKKKPPRYDLRDNKIHDPDLNGDPDMKDEAKADKDPDLSLNYKRVARRFFARKTSPTESGAKALWERHKQKSPGTKLNWQDFFERKDKGTIQEVRDAIKPKDKPKDEPAKPKKPKAPEDEGEAKEKPEDEDKAKKKPAEGEAPTEDPQAEQAAKEKEHKERVQSAVTDSAQAYDSVFGGGRVQVPREVSRYLPQALSNMTPEQVESFNQATQQRAQAMQNEGLRGENVVERAERTLDDYSDEQIENISDPARLAQVVADLTFSEHVLSLDKKRQKGVKRALSKAFDQIEKQLQKETKDGRYRLPSEIRRTISDQMGSLEPDQIQQFVQGVTENLADNATKYDDSDESVERAQGDLEEFSELIEGVSDPNVMAQEVASQIRAKRVVEKHKLKQGDRKRAMRKVNQALARSMGVLVSELPRDLRGKLDAAMEHMDPSDVLSVSEAVTDEAGKLMARYGENPEDPGLLAEAVQMASVDKLNTTDPRTLAQQAALLLMAHGKLASPFEVGGTEVSNVQKSPEELKARGQAAFDKFAALPQELRDTAAKDLHRRIKATKKDTPEHAELNRILDGLALAAWTDPENERIPSIPGRATSARFVEIAKAMRADGKIHELLDAATDQNSSAAIGSMRDAMARMSDDSLIRAMKDSQPELAKALEDSMAGGIEAQYLTSEKTEILRDVMRDIAVDEMAFMDAVIGDAMEAGGKDKSVMNFLDPNERGKFIKKLTEKRSKHSKGFLELLKNLGSKFQSLRPTKTADQNSGWGVSNLRSEEFKIKLRQENLRGVLNFVQAEFGELPNSPAVLAIQRFLETGNPDFLNSEPAKGEFGQEDENSGKKSSSKFQSSPYTGALLSAGLDACAGRSVAPSRRTPMSEALKQAKLLTSHFDNVAELVQKNAALFQIPEKIAFDFAKRCDLISDHLEKHAGQWTMDPKGNFNIGPAQPFNPAEIGEQDATPPKTEPDEPYMKKNFIQEEFDELREVQQTGGFSNARAAAQVNATFAKMAAKVAELEAKLAASEIPTADTAE